METDVTCNFDLGALRRTPEDTVIRYCPPYTAAKKAGHPKNDKQMKSPAEGTKKRRNRNTQEETVPKRRRRG